MNFDFIYRGENKDLDDAARAAAPGSFTRLPDGCTHFELGGPSMGPATVLVHGFSVPYFVWDPTFEALSAAGLRMLRYDLFGRGLSDRPRLAYDADLFVRQLGDLLGKLQLAQVNLIGLSMGGAVAATFTVRCPARVHKLALIDPIGTQPMPLNLLYRMALLPGLSNLLLGLAGSERILKGIASDFFDPTLVRRFQDQYRGQLQYHGFKRALLSTLHNKMIDGFPGVYAQLGNLNIPVLLIWGKDDNTLPVEQSGSILDLVPKAKFCVIDNAGHTPHYDRPEEVNPILLDFLVQP